MITNETSQVNATSVPNPEDASTEQQIQSCIRYYRSLVNTARPDIADPDPKDPYRIKESTCWNRINWLSMMLSRARSNSSLSKHSPPRPDVDSARLAKIFRIYMIPILAERKASRQAAKKAAYLARQAAQQADEE